MRAVTAGIDELLRFDGGGPRLEGHLRVPPGAVHGAVVCHPHPAYGGTMDNNVVVGLVQALDAAAVATLRFNFRGVGASEGRHAGGVEETHDVAAAVDCLAARVPDVALTVAGYSFGAAVALRAGCNGLPGVVTGLVGVAPPVAVVDLAFLAACALPVQLVAGELDAYCPRPALEALAGAASQVRVAWIPGADHFLAGREAAVAEPVTRFILGEAGG